MFIDEWFGDNFYRISLRFVKPRADDRRGLLGVLGEAATRGLVELAPAIGRLRTTSFRASPALLKAILDRFGSR